MTLPRNASASFRLAAAELGMCSAARLFTSELASAGGDALLEEACQVLGPQFPVLDMVAGEALAGRPPRPIDAAACVEALRSPSVVLIVGLEAFFLDALVAALPDARLGLVLGEAGDGLDVRRVIANFGERVQEVRLGDVQRWAGNKSALLSFVYGATSVSAYVAPIWLRVAGSDIRTQFRTLVGWDVLGAPTRLYPRWLVESPLELFSRVVIR